MQCKTIQPQIVCRIIEVFLIIQVSEYGDSIVKSVSYTYTAIIGMTKSPMIGSFYWNGVLAKSNCRVRHHFVGSRPRDRLIYIRLHRAWTPLQDLGCYTGLKFLHKIDLSPSLPCGEGLSLDLIPFGLDPMPTL